MTLAPLILVAWAANERFSRFKKWRSAEHPLFADISIPEDYDAVIFGSSRARQAFNPGVIEAKGNFFNLALPGSAARMMRIMVEFFLDRGNRTRFALLEVNPRTFDTDALWRRPHYDVSAMGYDFMLQLHRRCYGRGDILEEIRLFKYSIPFLQDRSPPEETIFGKHWENMLWSRKTPEDRRRYFRGFIPLLGGKSSLPETVKVFSSPKYEVYHEEVEALEAVIQRLLASGATVVMVQTPTYHWNVVGDVYDRYVREIDNLVQRYGLVHLNYRNGSPESGCVAASKNFWDWTHLSEKGAGLFTREIWERLEK